ncbi:MAG TPA: hypothetical protein PKZ67_10740, partial [Accumulibacter sp.]|nr:hypothetical protein [Accumulibacter sp.]
RSLILGSASPELLRRAAESLAGRVTCQELDGFGLDELAAASRLGAIDPNWLDSRWLRGGFPRALLANACRPTANGETRSFAPIWSVICLNSVSICWH